ncbi:VOC family protein [Sorangium sp. So ce426]
MEDHHPPTYDAIADRSFEPAPLRGTALAPSTATFMVNYRVEDLHALVKVLREEGCNVLEKIDDSEYGKFAWVIDPEGNKVELWQPPAGQ